MLCGVKLFGASALVWLLSSGVAMAGDGLGHPIARGEQKTLEGRTSFTFWTEPDRGGNSARRYLLLPPGTDPKLFLEGHELKAPPGLTVKISRLEAKEEDFSRSQKNVGVRTTQSWKGYAIQAELIVSAAADCPEGDFTIKIAFPAVAKFRDDLGATDPQGTPVMQVHVKTFATQEARQQHEREYNFPAWLAIGGFAVLLTLIFFGYVWLKGRLGF
jgi:hypothetical protein